MAKTHSIDMTNGPITKKLFIFVIPLMLSGMLQLLFNAADVVVVGRFAGPESLAAVGSTGSVVNLIVNLFIGMSVGANVTVAKHIGAGNKDGASRTAHTAIFLSLVIGFFLIFIGIFLSKQILLLMSSPPDVIDKSTLYLRIYFLGAPGFLLYNFGSALLRSQGDTKRPLIYLSISGAVNVIINLFAVIVLKLDVAGVAIATVISQYLSATLVLRCLLKETGVLRIEIKKLKIYNRELKEILRVGIPAGLQSVVFSLSNVVIQSTINTFGSTVIAGSAAAANIEGFIYIAMNAFYQATITFCSQNLGANKLKRVNKCLLTSLLFVTVIGVIMGSLVVMLGHNLLSIYSTDEAVIAAGMTRFKYIASLYVACGIMETLVGGLRGIGASISPMLISVLGACGVRILWIIFIFPLNPTEGMLYLSYIVSWIITSLAHTVCYIIIKARLNKRLKA